MKPIALIPAAGKSSRYRGDKPKWLRTHPDGRLMLNYAIQSFREIECDIYLITTQEIANLYNIQEILNDGCSDLAGIILLENETSSAIETLVEAIKKFDNLSLDTPLFVKDCDNFVYFKADDIDYNESFTIGCDIYSHDIKRITNKSFLVKNDLGYVIDFVEKRVVSDIISVGTHYFRSISLFLNEAMELLAVNDTVGGEKYISHVIASCIYNGYQFKLIDCIKYIDFGTQEEWDKIQQDHKVLFCDFDGTLVSNKGRYGNNNWFNRIDEPLIENIKTLKLISNRGGQIIITTSRCESEKEYIRNFLSNFSIEIKDIICDCYHSPRYLINDFADTNPYPSCVAINLPRNGSLSDFF